MRRLVYFVLCRALGPEHQLTLRHAVKLASALWGDRNYATALQLQEKIAGMCAQTLGLEHAHTVAAMDREASMKRLVKKRSGDLAGAALVETWLMEHRQRFLGERHPGTQESMEDLAETLTALKDLEDAKDLRIACLLMSNERDGSDCL